MSVRGYLAARKSGHLMSWRNCTRCGVKLVFVLAKMDEDGSGFWTGEDVDPELVELHLADLAAMQERRARQDPNAPKCICRVPLGPDVEYWDDTEEQHTRRCSCGGTRLNHPYRCDGRCDGYRSRV